MDHWTPRDVNARKANRHNVFPRRIDAIPHTIDRGRSLLQTMHKMDAACRIGVTAALLLFRAGPALSQQVPPQLLPELQDDIRSNETLQSRFDRRGLIEPIEIGPFVLATQVQGDVGFNDNIFAQSTGQKADFFFDLGLKGVATYHNEAFSAELDTYFLDHQYVSF